MVDVVISHLQRSGDGVIVGSTVPGCALHRSLGNHAPLALPSEKYRITEPSGSELGGAKYRTERSELGGAKYRTERQRARRQPNTEPSEASSAALNSDGKNQSEKSVGSV